MPTTFRPYQPDQGLLLPASLDEWLPEGHLCYFVAEAVDALDLSAFYARYDGDGRRRQPFDPRMMVKVLVYAYASGVFSSRKIARRLHEDVAFRVLAANNFPKHRTIREFRQLHLKEFSALFVQVVKLAREAGLIKLGRLGVDGTKVRANASKHKAMSYGRMKDEEKRLKGEIAELLKRAEAVDLAEDHEDGGDDGGGDLPQELQRREQRLQVIQAAKARLEERQREADAAEGRSKDEQGITRGATGRACQRELGVPQDQAQENFTDPQSRIMSTTEGFQQCYNGQAAVDEDSHMIVAADLTNNSSDAGQLVPLVKQTQDNTGGKPQMTVADAGYAAEEAFRELEQRGIEACVALGPENKAAQRKRKLEEHPATARMAQRLQSPQGQAHYRRRKTIPEPVFGWIKQVLGFRRFSMRGLAAAKAEWQLVCMAINLRRMQQMGWKAA